MIDLEECQVIHLDFVDLAAHIRQHVILRGKTHLILFVLLKISIYCVSLLALIKIIL